jgi:Flp pilus assembly protein TadG
MLRTLINDQRGSEVLEFALVFPVIIGVIILGITFAQLAYSKAAVELAAREAARTYAVNINNNVSENEVIALARESVKGNFQGIIPLADRYFNPETDVIITSGSLAGGTVIPDSTGEYCQSTVSVKVPIQTPWIRRLIGTGMPNDPTWDDPLGKAEGTEYVFPIEGTAVFKKEPRLEAQDAEG